MIGATVRRARQLLTALRRSEPQEPPTPPTFAPGERVVVAAGWYRTGRTPNAHIGLERDGLGTVRVFTEATPLNPARVLVDLDARSLPNRFAPSTAMVPPEKLRRIPAQTAANFDKPVRVGDSRYVHIRSSFYADETRCGLPNAYPAFFKDTTEAVTCPHCLRSPAS